MGGSGSKNKIGGVKKKDLGLQETGKRKIDGFGSASKERAKTAPAGGVLLNVGGTTAGKARRQAEKERITEQKRAAGSKGATVGHQNKKAAKAKRKETLDF